MLIVRLHDAKAAIEQALTMHTEDVFVVDGADDTPQPQLFDKLFPHFLRSPSLRTPGPGRPALSRKYALQGILKSLAHRTHCHMCGWYRGGDANRGQASDDLLKGEGLSMADLLTLIVDFHGPDLIGPVNFRQCGGISAQEKRHGFVHAAERLALS